MTFTIYFTALLCMLFFHCLADFCLQGVLADMKQAEWWVENAPKNMENPHLYDKDYVVALIVHSFMWSFMIMIPPMIVTSSYCKFNIFMYITSLFVNTAVHSAIDDAKANKHSISLLEDQAMHSMQVLITAFCMMI